VGGSTSLYIYRGSTDDDVLPGYSTRLSSSLDYKRNSVSSYHGSMMINDVGRVSTTRGWSYISALREVFCERMLTANLKALPRY
jgi:hypothetical protein